MLPGPVTFSVQPLPPLAGVVNVAFHTPPEAVKADTVDAPEQPPPQVARCGLAQGAMLDLTQQLQSAPVGEWRTMSYSLACFSTRGADLSNVEAPFAIESAARFSLTIANVRLVEHRGPLRCGGG